MAHAGIRLGGQAGNRRAEAHADEHGGAAAGPRPGFGEGGPHVRQVGLEARVGEVAVALAGAGIVEPQHRIARRRHGPGGGDQRPVRPELFLDERRTQDDHWPRRRVGDLVQNPEEV
jgi:hypothetical protein